ncbi:hypothetical protein QQS21_001315 [Conoideocrella luteorostrata]|uniref:Ubiquitin-like domain-containing protein n=1 Tax=Conoideocrella luteorostrata TaxID=1105319 RepID=A0AAJ0D083_9HYPO|nr:hypothetical protein QQS21_001315 [Conoideocrella luteorostrata]
MTEPAMTEADQQAPVHFKDAIGRKFTFPFKMVRTWKAMRELVQSAFLHVDVLGPIVLKGQFDLIGPNDEIILPAVWDSVIQPGMSIIMTMWPIDKLTQLVPLPPPNRPMPPASQQPAANAAQVHPKSTPLPSAPADHALNENLEEPREITKANSSALLSFLSGKPSKNKGKSSKLIAKPARQAKSPRRMAHMPASAFEPPNKGLPPRFIYLGENKTTGQPVEGLNIPRRASKTVGHILPQGSMPPPGRKIRYASKSNVRFSSPPTGLNRQYTTSKSPGLPGPPAAVYHSDSSSDSSSESDGDESLLSADSRSNARCAGLIIRTRRQSRERRLLRQPTFSVLEPDPTPVERHDFSSARVYPDDISPGSIALELTKYSGHSPSEPNLSGADKITWLHVSRKFMDFDEFEHIALHNDTLAATQDNRQAMESVFKVLYDKKLAKSRENWFVQSGTVIRCDVDSGEECVASATFVSIPQVQVDPFNENFDTKFHKGVCVPRKLHETFNPHDTSFECDKNQAFRKQDGAAADEILWICETWILIVDSVGILSYGSRRRRPVLEENINIRESPQRTLEDKIIHVVTSDYVQFHVPFVQCETFFKLQCSIMSKLKAVKNRSILFGNNVELLDSNNFELLDSNGEPLTAKSWSNITKKTWQGVIRIKVRLVEDVISSSSSDSSLSLDVYSDASTEESIIVEIGKDDNNDDEFFGIHKDSAAESDSGESFTLPELLPIVPPFLAWSIVGRSSSSLDATNRENQNQNDDDWKEAIRACLLRIETALIERHHPHVATLQEKFPSLNFNHGTVQVGLDNIGLHIDSMSTPKKIQHRSQTPGCSVEELSSIYKDYLLGSILALEAFTPKREDASLLSLYYSALSEGTQYLKLEQNDHGPRKYVITRKPIPIPGYKYLQPPLAQTGCDECKCETVYDSVDEAMDHLRRKHCSDTTSETRLKEYLLPLSTAAEARLNREYRDVLSMCRDTMLEIAKKARDIQEGVVFDDHFRPPPQGVPYALLKALQLAVAFVCTTPILLNDLQTFYKQTIYQDELNSIAPNRQLREKYQVLKITSSEIESLMKAAERALISSAESRKDEDVVKFFSSTGPHGLAILMVSNILEEPVYNNMNTAELYRNYTSSLKIKEQHNIINYNIEQASKLIDIVNSSSEITKDDHNRAIFVFTVVTVVFLPLGFVAAYLSMNGGPSNQGWDDTQRLFWRISVPLAVGVGIFCVTVAWQDSKAQAIRHWIVDQVNLLKNRFQPRAGSSAPSEIKNKVEYEGQKV